MNIKELRDKVARFEKLDKEALSDLKQSNKFPMHEKYFEIIEAKNEVKQLLVDVRIAKIHDSTLSRKIKNIRDNRGYFVDNITNVLEKLCRLGRAKRNPAH